MTGPDPEPTTAPPVLGADPPTLRASIASTARRVDRPLVRGAIVGALVLAIAVVGVVLAWPVARAVLPMPGLALSWRAGLHQAAVQDLGYPDEVLFTYGPLGYLSIPEFFHAESGSLAVASVAICLIGLMIAVAAIQRRRVGLVAAALIVLVVARITSGVDLTFAPVIAAVAVASGVAAGNLDRRSRITALVGLAVLGSLMLLVKTNAGVAILGLTGLLAIATGGRRPWLVLTAVGTATAALVVIWALIGQDVERLPDFILGSLDLAAGYSTAMGLPGAPWEVPLAAAVAIGVGALVVADRRAGDRQVRAGWLLAIGFVLFMAWKHGIVRQGLDGYFAEALLIGLVAVDLRRIDRRLLVGAVSMLVVAVLLTTPIQRLLDVRSSVDAARSDIETAISPGAATQAAEQTRLTFQTAYGLPAPILEAVAGATTHIEGWETAVAVAYPELHWRPLPVFQAYAVFTSTLDARNAAVLSGDRAPERILRHRPRSIDGRLWRFDGPRTTLEMFCRYREIASTLAWQVLAASPSRCGLERVIGTVVAAEGAPVRVPGPISPSSLLAVRIDGVGDGIVDTLESALFRGPTWQVRLDGLTYRFVPDTASGPLLIGSTADIGYRDGYGIKRTITELAVARETMTDPASLTYTFVEIPFQPVVPSSALGKVP